MVDKRRRSALKGAALAAAAAATQLEGLVPVASALEASTARRRAAIAVRQAATRRQLIVTAPDRWTPADHNEAPVGFFSKGLSHEPSGEVRASALEALRILKSGGTIALADGVRPLNNPFSGDGFSLVGSDPQGLTIPSPPLFASSAEASEMVELYWLSLMRDVPFATMGIDETVAAAQRELVALGLATRDAAHRWVWQGLDGRDGLPGPAISQLLLRDIPYGPKTVVQTYPAPLAGQAFLTDVETLLPVWSGARTRQRTEFQPLERHIATGRDLAEYVRRDFTYQAFLNGALIIMATGEDSFADTELSRRRTGCTNDILFGDKSVLSLLAEVSVIAQKAAFFQKWQRFNRLRPEELGFWVERHRAGHRNPKLPASLTQSAALELATARQGTSTLAQAYPEGCPLHPSYPAAHAVNAAACGTILKAFFSGRRTFDRTFEAGPDGTLRTVAGQKLTIEDEIDKLVINISVARSMAGVHFRSDNAAGVVLGERVALALLQDTARTMPRKFEGFRLRSLNGRQLIATPDQIRQE